MFQKDRSTFEIKHYILRKEVQKRESGSPKYISTDEQISRYFSKSFVQEKKVCVLKKQVEARGYEFLIKKERDDSQVGREH